jgi:hypothetical protein
MGYRAMTHRSRPLNGEFRDFRLSLRCFRNRTAARVSIAQWRRALQ